MGLLKVIDRALSRLSGVDVRAEDARDVYPYRLTDPVMHMGHTPYLLGDLLEHLLIQGGTGSGKSSAILPAFVQSYFRHGFGGLCLTVKGDDTERILRLAAQTGRLDDVILINSSQGWVFNFLDHAFSGNGAGAGQVENVVSTLLEVIENRAESGKRQQSDAYWMEGVRRLLRHTMEVIRLGGLRVTMQHIGAVIHGMPVAGENGQPITPPDSFLVECMGRAEQAGHHVQYLHNYFWREMARPGSSRQVAGIVSTFSNMADPFLSGQVATLFASDQESNWTPELTRIGKIIILDMPILDDYGDVGRSAQLLVKKIWIDAMLKRQGLPRGEVPCFMLADEYQLLTTPYDARLMQAGRSSYVSALCMTQNLNGLYATFDGVRAQYQAHAMLGNFSTLIGCRNHDKTTNEWFADTIAKTLVRRRNHSASWGESSGTGGNIGFNAGHSTSMQGGSASWGDSGGVSWNSGESFNTSAGVSEQFDYPVAPSVFTQLGVANGQVQAIVFKAGKRFAPHGLPFTGQLFHQR